MMRVPLACLWVGILSGCAGSPDAMVPAAADAKLLGATHADLSDRPWAEAGLGTARLQHLYRASAVKVQHVQASEVMTGIGIDAYHVVMKCPAESRGFRVWSSSSATEVGARVLAKGPDKLCVLRTNAEMAGWLPLALNTDAQVGAVVHSPSGSQDGEAWISTPIEEILGSESGKRLRVSARPVGSAVQPLFDDQGRIVGVLSEVTQGSTVATGMDWLVPLLVRPTPCLTDGTYADKRPGDGELPTASVPAPKKGTREEILVAIRAYSVMLNERTRDMRQPNWYPAGANARGLEGTRKAIMRFRDGRLEKIEIEDAETDLLAMGVRQLLDCIPLPELPDVLQGVAFSITQPFVFDMSERIPTSSEPARIGDEDRR